MQPNMLRITTQAQFNCIISISAGARAGGVRPSQRRPTFGRLVCMFAVRRGCLRYVSCLRSP